MPTFKHVPADDETVDGEWQLLDDQGNPTNFSIQDCYSYTRQYVLNEYGPSRENLEWVQHHGHARSLAQAKAAILKLWETTRAEA